jgi:hypothetical protein
VDLPLLAEPGSVNDYTAGDGPMALCLFSDLYVQKHCVEATQLQEAANCKDMCHSHGFEPTMGSSALQKSYLHAMFCLNVASVNAADIEQLPI